MHGLETSACASLNPNMAKPILPVVCAVIISNGLILAVRRGENQSNAGLWEFPGGKVEPNESNQQALIREIEEELMVQVLLAMHLKPVIWEDETRIIELRPYFAEISFGEIQLREHSSMQWLKPEELDSLQWAPADIPVVQQVIEALKDV